MWRIFAKFLLHRILPPTFRFLAQIVTLPHRRFYTPATDYKDVPVDKGLHPIPSVLDLPGMLELEVDGVSTARTSRSALGARGLKMRAGRGLGSGRPEKGVSGSREGLGLGLEEMGEKPNDVVRHYDADGERPPAVSRVCDQLADHSVQCSRRCSCIAASEFWRRA